MITRSALNELRYNVRASFEKKKKNTNFLHLSLSAIVGFLNRLWNPLDENCRMSPTRRFLLFSGRFLTRATKYRFLALFFFENQTLVFPGQLPAAVVNARVP